MLAAKKTLSNGGCCSHLIPLMGPVSNSMRECWVGPSRVKSKWSFLGHRERLLCCCSQVAANDIRKTIKYIYFQDRVVSILGTRNIHFALTKANWSWAVPSPSSPSWTRKAAWNVGRPPPCRRFYSITQSANRTKFVLMEWGTIQFNYIPNALIKNSSDWSRAQRRSISHSWNSLKPYEL